MVLLDNGRTKLLADRNKRQSLYCIRCGACLNHCPVYRKIGGHNYPWVYSGPIGAIITPQYQGITQQPWLPYASSLCGACAEVCPVKIDIPQDPARPARRSCEGQDARGRGTPGENRLPPLGMADVAPPALRNEHAGRNLRCSGRSRRMDPAGSRAVQRWSAGEMAKPPQSATGSP